MDNTKPHDWESLIALLQKRGETGLISLLYSFAAEEKGRSFEDLYDRIKDVSEICKLDLDEAVIEQIWTTAPLLFAE